MKPVPCPERYGTFLGKALVAALLAATMLVGCDAGADRKTLTVFAAASLTETFGELEQAFEDEHPDVDVRLSFGGSSRLAEQIVEGAPAGVFASADEKSMTTVTDAKLAADEPRIFATNTLTIAVAPGNPEGIKGLDDLRRDDLIVVTCAAEVPCGRAAAGVADRAGVELEPTSEEPDVRSVLGKVTTGEADVGLVYVTDAKDTEAVGIAEAAAEPNRYPIVALSDSEQAALAERFAEFVLADAGQQVLRDAGFGAP